MMYNANLKKNEIDTISTNMRKFTKVMNETLSKLKDMEQTLEEEELSKMSTDVDILKTELQGLKRD